MEPLDHPEDQFARDVSMPLEPEEHAIQIDLLQSFFASGPRSIFIQFYAGTKLNKNGPDLKMVQK